MCGIVGVMAKKNIERMSPAELNRMCHIMRHRGPDDEGGVYLDLESSVLKNINNEKTVNTKLMLGFDRLSIQDLSLKGHQPMLSEDRRVAIALNGEIYNFKELRNDLVNKGYFFSSGTDTEVLLNMYLEYGLEETLHRINGMYAFAIVDSGLKKIYLVRDRFGIKPLYLANTDGALLFASELKCFLEYHDFRAELNRDALEELMIFRGLLKNTMLKNVEEIPSGSIYTIDLADNHISTSRYFDIENYHRKSNDVSYADLKQKVKETLKTVLNRQIISDASVGCQLSGGIDSTLITGLCSEMFGIRDTVSCVIDKEWQSDEPYIDVVNEKHGLEAHKIKINSTVFVKNLAENVWHFDRPLSHTPATGMYLISNCSEMNGITVLLSGEGADEMFGGYKGFHKTAFLKEQLSEDEITEAIIFREGKYNLDVLRQVLPEIEPEKYVAPRKDLLMHFSGSAFDRQLKYETAVKLAELLDRQDKMSMAHSIENRVPFLDNDMTEIAWSIPEKFLMNSQRQEGKYILKDIVAEQYGEDFAFRKKVGFFIPGNLYLCQNPEYLEAIIASAKKRNIVNMDIIEKWGGNEAKQLGKLDFFSSALFLKLITFEIWCQLFLDEKGECLCF